MTRTPAEPLHLGGKPSQLHWPLPTQLVTTGDSTDFRHLKKGSTGQEDPISVDLAVDRDTHHSTSLSSVTGKMSNALLSRNRSEKGKKAPSPSTDGSLNAKRPTAQALSTLGGFFTFPPSAAIKEATSKEPRCLLICFIQESANSHYTEIDSAGN